MAHKWSLVAAVTLMLTGIASVALAQTGQPGRVELFGAAALHKLWDDESSIGDGISGGGGVSVALTDRLSIRGRVMRSSNEHDFGTGVMFTANGTRYTADLIWQPSPGTHAPYFGVGAGGFSYTRTSYFTGAQTFRRSGTETTFGGLAGFTAVSNKRFRLRPEASLWWSRPGYFITIEIGVIAAWRF